MKKILMVLALVAMVSVSAKELKKTTIGEWNFVNSASLLADKGEGEAKTTNVLDTLKGFEVSTGYAGSYIPRASNTVESFYDVGYYTAIAYKFNPNYGVRASYSKVEEVEFKSSKTVKGAYQVNSCGCGCTKVVGSSTTKKTTSTRDVERYIVDALFYTSIKGYEFYKIVGFGYSNEDELYENNVFINIGVGYYRELYKGFGINAEIKLVEDLSDDFRKPEIALFTGVSYRF